MWALIPIKKLDNAKQRLSGLLRPNERKQLFRCMVLDVLKVLSEHPLISGIAIVSNDEEGAFLAKKFDALLINEAKTNQRGLNGAVEQGVSFLAELDTHDVMVIHGDLPLITEDEINRLLYAHSQSTSPALTLVPDSQLQGSNCLVCSPASSMRFHYGTNSLNKHRAQALKSGINFQLFSLDAMGLDIDLPTDVENLLGQLAISKNIAQETKNYLELSGIGKRIEDSYHETFTGYKFKAGVSTLSHELSQAY